MGERLVTVARDVSEHDRDDAGLGDEEVVEVPARGGPLGRSVGDRHVQAAELARDLRHERRLHRAHVPQQPHPLPLEAARAGSCQARANAEP